MREANGAVTYVWSGDQWFSSLSGLKGDDHQYWQPLEFAEQNVPGMEGAVPVPRRRGPAWQPCFDVDLSHLGTVGPGCTAAAGATGGAGGAAAASTAGELRSTAAGAHGAKIAEF